MTAIAASALLALSGCGTAVPQETQNTSQIITGYVDQYKTLPGAKALAYTKENGQYVFGSAYDYHSQKSANQRAMRQCEEKRKKLHVKHPCQMLAEGDRFIRHYE